MLAGDVLAELCALMIVLPGRCGGSHEGMRETVYSRWRGQERTFACRRRSVFVGQVGYPPSLRLVP